MGAFEAEVEVLMRRYVDRRRPEPVQVVAIGAAREPLVVWVHVA